MSDTSYIGRADLPPGLRNNNPGNIRPSAGITWQGSTGTANNFVVFQSVYWGLRALARDISTKIGRGLNTIRLIISEYAPPSENDTASYIAAVSRDTGLTPDEPVNVQDNLHDLMSAIINHELGAGYAGYISDTDIDAGIGMAGGQSAGEESNDPGVSDSGSSGPGTGTLLGLAGAAVLLWLIFRE